jgi:iron complex outermembrane receptor protein
VLAGQELAKQIEMSLGATLEHQPSVAVRSFGPAPARPVIRGLDGDRVLILQDGQRTGDLSSQSGDHGVVVNPAAAQRIEVVRGPATLLYGANAIGGLVNVITDEIPTVPEQGVRGSVRFDLGTAADQGAAAGNLHVGNGTFALHVGGGGQRSGDVGTPAGSVDNSQSRNGFGSVGLAWTGARGYIGGSYGYDDTRYGIPVAEEGRLQLTPRRHALTARAGAERLTGAFDALRATVAHRRYMHEEVEGGQVGTTFHNDTTEVELMASHATVGRLKGSIGGWILHRAFDAVGDEALSPAVDQRGVAVFVYEELTWPHVTLQFGARVDRTRFEPVAEERRSFTNPSFSAGALFRPAAAHDALTVAVSLARAARNPALEELFFFGEHHGNFAFEVGNPELASEKALGLDLSLRWRSSRVSGEVTVFRNDISEYIFRRPLTEEEFEAREDAFDGRFPGRGVHHHHEEGEEELGFQLIEYVGADAVLQGVETHADVQISPTLVAEVGFDYVRGTLKASRDALPRMPPARVRAGLRYQRNAFQAGGEIARAAAQRRTFGAESATDAYTLLRLFGVYTFQAGGVINTITARLDNATDELYRNHLSLIKDVVPEMGRNFKVLYGIAF